MISFNINLLYQNKNINKLEVCNAKQLKNQRLNNELNNS